MRRDKRECAKSRDLENDCTKLCCMLPRQFGCAERNDKQRSDVQQRDPCELIEFEDTGEFNEIRCERKWGDPIDGHQRQCREMQQCDDLGDNTKDREPVLTYKPLRVGTYFLVAHVRGVKSTAEPIEVGVAVIHR